MNLTIDAAEGAQLESVLRQARVGVQTGLGATKTC